MPYKRPRLLEPETPESMQGPRRRRRAAVSCIACRERKVACNRCNPCNYCVTNRIECNYKSFQTSPLGAGPQSRPQPAPAAPALDSPSVPAAPLAIDTYSLPQRRTNHRYGPTFRVAAPAARDPAPVAEPTPAPLSNTQPLDRVVPSPAPPPPADPVLPPAPIASLGDDSRQDRQSDQNNRPGLRQQLQRVPTPQSPLTTTPIYGLDDSGWRILKHRLGLADADVVLNKSRIPRWSEWMGTAPEFSTVHACFTAASTGDLDRFLPRPDVASSIAEMRDYLQKTRVIAKTIKASGIAKFASISADHLPQLPSRESADTMVALYFDNFESTHRILHIPSFCSDYERYWSDPVEVSVKLRLKVLLVVAIGASLHESFDTDSVLREQVFQWVHAAGDWLSLPWEKPRLDVEGLQVQCLTFLARQVFATGGDTIWESMGTLLNTAMQMNLHRDPKYLPKMSILEAQIRRRLWYTVLELEMQTALDTAMAPRFSLADFDTGAPSNINDDELIKQTTVLSPDDRSSYTQTSLQLLLLSTAPIRHRILTTLNGLKSSFSYGDVLTLSQELTTTHAKMTKLVHDSQPGLSAFKRNLVEFLARGCLLPLHCPFVSLALTNPLFQYSRKISVDTAMTIACPEPDIAYSRLLRLGGNLLREGLRCAATGLCSEVIAQVDSQRSDFTQHHAVSMADTLKKALEEVIQLSAEQVKRCDRNTKLHMFLSMVQAHVKSTSTGALHKALVARAGRDSLALCHGLLQTSYGMAISPAPDLPVEQPPDALNANEGVGDVNLDWDFGFFVPDTGYFRQFA